MEFSCHQEDRSTWSRSLSRIVVARAAKRRGALHLSHNHLESDPLLGSDSASEARPTLEPVKLHIFAKQRHLQANPSAVALITGALRTPPPLPTLFLPLSSSTGISLALSTRRLRSTLQSRDYARQLGQTLRNTSFQLFRSAIRLPDSIVLVSYDT
ncbi:hypothetical protein V1477_003040 [Vespula maculifrons]|uniref:Uncharacterized protein n=1 Tax=Vespula maculifrons TaxID=7453 RepID=A0ABD2CTH8_VESMC